MFKIKVYAYVYATKDGIVSFPIRQPYVRPSLMPEKANVNGVHLSGVPAYQMPNDAM